MVRWWLPLGGSSRIFSANLYVFDLRSLVMFPTMPK
jgi:hypothetical protein